MRTSLVDALSGLLPTLHVLNDVQNLAYPTTEESGFMKLHLSCIEEK